MSVSDLMEFQLVGDNIYSTDEKVIGRWIDGKPLYQKTIDFGKLPNTADKRVNHNISDLKDVLVMYGVAVFTQNGNRISIPLPNVGAVNQNNIALFRNSTSIGVTTYSDRSMCDGYIIIQYTKITD